ncbi:shikimate kinase [Yoonia sp. R2331]|uniref:shikimate kinase n=1 Tax=Yoonia sp. R2331 TaxID=3237238 RepID=UPI0034E42121
MKCGEGTKALRLKRTIVLVGMMGSGKSAIGRALSARLQVPFQDSDAAIEEAAQDTIADIFARDGEAFFRRRESEVIKRLLDGPPAVLSTGGGAFLAARNRDIIAEAGAAVWLDAPLRLLWERVRHKDTRPLLRTADPLATLTALFEERTPIYALATLRLSVRPNNSIDETTQSLIQLLLEHPDLLEAAT